MNEPLHILYISQYFPPEMGAPSARVYELSRYWSGIGQKITVLTGFPHHPTGKIHPGYRQHFFKRERLNGIQVVRTYVYPTPNKGFFKRILSYFSFMLSAVFMGVWHTGKADLIIATSPQFFVVIAGYIISRIKHKPFIFEVRDLWPESIVQLGQLRNSLIIKILEGMEVFLYRKAALIVAVADASIPLLVQKGIPAEKIRVIKNGVDLTLFEPGKKNPDLSRRLGLENKFVVSYIGTMGLSHALDKILATANLLRDNSQINFLLIGEGAEKDKLIRMKERLGLQNVTFLDQIDKQELPYYYNLSDLVLVTLRKLPLFQCVIPSKIFEIMAMAKPIIITVDGEARALVESAGAGIFIEPENEVALCETIIKLYRDAEGRQKLGAAGRAFVERFYDRNRLADDYYRILENLNGML